MVNATPTANLAAARAADRARIADIEVEILDFQRCIDELRDEQRLAKKRLESYHYPVLTLPYEIASEISIRFLPVYPDCPPLTGLLSPMILTRICRRWRELSLAIPALWRAISLSPVDSQVNERKTALVELWLKRSGTLPLSIRVNATQLTPHECIGAFVHHRARWEYVLGFLSREANLASLSGPTPLLRHLDLSLDPTAVPTTFHPAPLLRSVVIHFYPDAIAIPWLQLTSLVLKIVYPHECTPILQQTGNLVHCELDLVQSIRDHNLPDVVLPYLETLTLKWDRDTGVSEPFYLSTLVVPALHKLQVSEASLGPDPVSTLTAFVYKSGCRILELCITGRTFWDGAAYRTAFPSIPHLSFEMVETSRSDSDSDT
ncbi:hypothetical protein C8R43DRAFT_978109 [Mycena crocata]|nr:hypothetical protein C8R43DRAFT_978109 [Mycena crocata]